jgi:hypothetical protein
VVGRLRLPTTPDSTHLVIIDLANPDSTPILNWRIRSRADTVTTPKNKCDKFGTLCATTVNGIFFCNLRMNGFSKGRKHYNFPLVSATPKSVRSESNKSGFGATSGGSNPGLEARGLEPFNDF